jgi:DNA-binding NarL/FixJ family response regulator
MTIWVLLPDDQQLVRAAFRDGGRVLLDAEPDIEVVGEAADGVAGRRGDTGGYRPVVLMDIWMPRLNGIEAAASITTSCERRGR